MDEAFQDRIAKFIASKSDLLYNTRKKSPSPSVHADDEDNGTYAVVPPLETFLDIPGHLRKRHFYDCLQKGDIIIGVVSGVQDTGLIVTILCMDKGKARDIDQLKITAFCPLREIPKSYAHEDPLEHYEMKDKVRGTVLNVSPQKELIVISFQQRALPHHLQNVKLGLINSDDLPEYFRHLQDVDGWQYNEYLERLVGFANPSNVATLSKKLGLSDHGLSLTRGLHDLIIDKEEEAESLRKRQSYRYALKSVAEGINHFKQGKQVEAMQYLNRALQIDKENVEALVARGALYANNESYLKAIEDFEEALNLNPNHHNAKKYMCETLVAHGRRLVEQDMADSAVEYLERALTLDKDNFEAEVLLKLARERISENLTPDSSYVTSRDDKRGRNNSHKTRHLSQLVETKELLRKIIEEDKEESSQKVKAMESAKSRQRSSSTGSSSSSSSSGSSSSGSSSSDSSSSSAASSKHSSSDRSERHSRERTSKHKVKHNTAQEKPKSYRSRDDCPSPKEKHDVVRSQQKRRSSEKSDGCKQQRPSSEEKDDKRRRNRSDSGESCKEVPNGRQLGKSSRNYEDAREKRRRSDDKQRDRTGRSRTTSDRCEDDDRRSGRTSDKYEGDSRKSGRAYKDSDDRRSHRDHADSYRTSRRGYEDNTDRRSRKKYEERSGRSYKEHDDRSDRRSYREYNQSRRRSPQHTSSRHGRSDGRYKSERLESSDEESSLRRRDKEESKRHWKEDYKHGSSGSYRSDRKYESEKKRCRLSSDEENSHKKEPLADSEGDHGSEKSGSSEPSLRSGKHGDRHQAQSRKESSQRDAYGKEEHECMDATHDKVIDLTGQSKADGKVADRSESLAGRTLESLKAEVQELTRSKWGGDNWKVVGSEGDISAQADDDDDDVLPTTSVDQPSNLPDVVQVMKTGSDVEDSDHEQKEKDAGHHHTGKRKHRHSHRDKSKKKDKERRKASKSVSSASDEETDGMKRRRSQMDMPKQGYRPSEPASKISDRIESSMDRKKTAFAQPTGEPLERDSLLEMENFLAMLKEKKKQQAKLEKS